LIFGKTKFSENNIGSLFLVENSIDIHRREAGRGVLFFVLPHKKIESPLRGSKLANIIFERKNGKKVTYLFFATSFQG
jgi:hypothetical protein